MTPSDETCYEHKQSPGKGIGTFAKVAIESGTRIMAEASILNMPNDYWLAKDVEDAFALLSDADKATFMSLHSAHGQIRSHWILTQRTFIIEPATKLRLAERYLCRTAKEPSILSIYLTNSIQVNNGSGIFPIISRINHSCVPNAVFVWNERIGKETIQAVKDIKKGEEITVSYCDSFHDKSIRAVQMREYGFVCQCPACGGEGGAGSFIDLSIQRRYRLRELADITQVNGERIDLTNEEADDLIIQYLEMNKLMFAEGLKTQEMARLYGEISWRCNNQKAYQFALQAAVMSHALYLETCGDDYDRTIRMAEVIEELRERAERLGNQGDLVGGSREMGYSTVV